MRLDEHELQKRSEPQASRADKRRRRIESAVRAGVASWRERNAAILSVPPVDPTAKEPAVRALPHPELIIEVPKGAKIGIPKTREEEFHAGVIRTAWRLVIWLWLIARLLLGNLLDVILFRRSIERRALRLRLVLQSGGATFIKLGQQMSLRIDLLPFEYTNELENMLDKVEPFPFKHALETIKEATDGPLEDTYAAIDPTPIGSASISCVYHAVLRNGERVAIKVRRPGVGVRLAADMRALGWIMTVMELVVLPPGFTRNFVEELRGMLLAELDFRMEARHQSIFRRRVRKAGLSFVTAPKIMSRLSSHRCIVEEFVTGVWFTDLLSAVESRDEQTLDILRQNDIVPRQVARRLLKVVRWSGLEGLLFHADLHPANIVVASGGKLILIDFGSCGAFTKSEVVVWRRFLYAQHQEDVAGMAQATISLMEPLPPVDLDELIKKVEALHWEHLYAYKDKNAEWWERTSARLWINFMKLAQEMQIPLGRNTLKMIRATMLVDTLALRLDHSIDQYREFNKYMVGAGKRARKRLRKGVRELFRPEAAIELEELVNAARTFVYRAKRSVDTTIAQTTSLIGKSAYAATAFLHFVVASVFATAAVGVGIAVQRFQQGYEFDIQAIAYQVITSSFTYIALLFTLFVYGRRLMYRLRDKE